MEPEPTTVLLLSVNPKNTGRLRLDTDGGMTIPRILEDYPQLEADGVEMARERFVEIQIEPAAW